MSSLESEFFETRILFRFKFGRFLFAEFLERQEKKFFLAGISNIFSHSNLRTFGTFHARNESFLLHFERQCGGWSVREFPKMRIYVPCAEINFFFANVKKWGGAAAKICNLVFKIHNRSVLVEKTCPIVECDL